VQDNYEQAQDRAHTTADAAQTERVPEVQNAGEQPRQQH